MPDLESISQQLARDPMFAERDDGTPIHRKAQCECGQAFNQRLLSERFLTIVATQSKRAMQLTEQQIPGFWVPVFCPRCERIDIGSHARRGNEW